MAQTWLYQTNRYVEYLIRYKKLSKCFVYLITFWLLLTIDKCSIKAPKTYQNFVFVNSFYTKYMKMIVKLSWVAIFGMLFAAVFTLPLEKTTEKNGQKNGDLPANKKYILN